MLVAWLRAVAAGVETWSEAGSILEMESSRFAHRLVSGIREKEESRMTPPFWSE